MKYLSYRTISRNVLGENERVEVDGTLERTYPVPFVPAEINAELSVTEQQYTTTHIKSGNKSFPEFDRLPQTEGACGEAPYLDKA